MPCCQALGRVGAFQKLQDPIVFVNDLHGAVSVMESKPGSVLQWFGPAFRPGAVALESESGTRPPARFMPFMPSETSGNIRLSSQSIGSMHS